MTSTNALPAPYQVALAPPPTGGEAMPSEAPADTAFQAFGADGFTFLDFLDVINPLQHIPLVSTLYRSFTGDSIDPGSRIAGGTLYGGPVGAGLAVANVALEEATGQDMGAHVLALFEGDDGALGDIAASDGPAETAHRDVQNHIEVRQWAEREAAFHAAQAAAMGMSATRHHAAGAPPPRERRDSLQTAAVSAATPQALPTALMAQAKQSGPAAPASPGAIAPDGGWFSDTMLTALTRYRETQRIADTMAAHTTSAE